MAWLTVKDMIKILENFDPNRPVAMKLEFLDGSDGLVPYLEYDINVQLDIDSADDPIVVISSN